MTSVGCMLFSDVLRSAEGLTDIDHFDQYASVLADIFAELKEYFQQHSEMSEFALVAAELEQQAKQLRLRKRLKVPPLNSPIPQFMPSRIHAQKVMQVISQLRPLGDEIDQIETIAIARVVENLVVGVTGTIFRQYPELFRSAAPVSS